MGQTDYGMLPDGLSSKGMVQEAFAPDGGYIPRILFAEPNGTLRPDLKNPANQKEYAYFYDSMEKVRMRRVAVPSFPYQRLPCLPLSCHDVADISSMANITRLLQVRAGMKKALKAMEPSAKDPPEQPATPAAPSKPDVSEL